MINSHLIEPFSHAYRHPTLGRDDHLVVDEIVRARRLSYRVGATLVSIGTRLMRGDSSSGGPATQAA